MYLIEGNNTVIEGNQFHPIIQQFLLTGEINPNIQDKSHNTALMYATEKMDSKLIDMLLNSEKTNVNLQNNLGNTALHCAVSNGDSETVRKLINNPKTNYHDNIEEMSPFLAAIFKRTYSLTNFAINGEKTFPILDLFFENPSSITFNRSVIQFIINSEEQLASVTTKPELINYILSKEPSLLTEEDIEYIDNNIQRLEEYIEKLHTGNRKKETVDYFPSTEEHLPIPQFGIPTKRKNISELLAMFKEIKKIVEKHSNASESSSNELSNKEENTFEEDNTNDDEGDSSHLITKKEEGYKPSENCTTIAENYKPIQGDLSHLIKKGYKPPVAKKKRGNSQSKNTNADGGNFKAKREKK